VKFVSNVKILRHVELSHHFLFGGFIMIIKVREKGQALILIALAAIGLFAFSALAIDGSRVYSDKRHAQNAADAAALAGALAHARGNDIFATAQTRATSNGYDNGDKSDVTITVSNSPSGVCPANTVGQEITVTIKSYVDTTFARIVGRTEVTNAVTATSRSCGSFFGPPFDGNAIVSLAPSEIGYDGNGTADWVIEGGGIFSNSTNSSAAHCQSNATSITVPSVTVVGNMSWGNCTMNISDSTTPGANAGSPLSYSDYSNLFPRQPVCDGTATQSGGQWHPQSGADGSKLAFSGDMDFAPGLYCVTNSPGPYHGELTGSEVTFYIMSSNFNMKFNGSGNSFNAQAPTDPNNEYRGVLMYMAPQVDANGDLLNTQQLDLRGNGNGDIVGTIIAPSADVTMFGNSGTGALDSQVIAYQVDSGGTAAIHLVYDSGDNYRAFLPISLTLLK
jgi:Flp pilus assembly protein TadG